MGRAIESITLGEGMMNSSFLQEETKTLSNEIFGGPSNSHEPTGASISMDNKMRNSGLSKWDPADSLETEEDMLLYLQIAMEDPFPELIAAILGDIARAKGVDEISGATFEDDCLREAISDATRMFPDASLT